MGEIRKPFQFGLASLFVMTTIAALAVWLEPETWRAAMYGLAVLCGVLAVVRLAIRFLKDRQHFTSPAASPLRGPAVDGSP